MNTLICTTTSSTSSPFPSIPHQFRPLSVAKPSQYLLSNIPNCRLSTGIPCLRTHNSIHSRKNPKRFRCVPANNVAEERGTRGDNDEEEDDDDEEYRVLATVRSMYNEIVILETKRSRKLLLDSTHNVHSVFMKGKKWTGSYWDEFASLPAIIPNGPVAILGLGGGTAAHLMLDLWPSLQLDAWEIDEILVDKAREFLGMSDLEKRNKDGGLLNVHVGDALSSSNTVPGGYAGIVVDLFSDGKVIPQLQEVETWLELSGKLMPNGRLMVNCGGIDNDLSENAISTEFLSFDDIRELNFNLDALCKAFPGKVSWKKTELGNYLALTGPLPDLDTWSASLPDPLSTTVMQWSSCWTP